MSTAHRSELLRHTRAIIALENLVRETFPDDLEIGWPDCVKKVAHLQNEFRGLAKVAKWRFDSLEHDLQQWRSRVAAGEEALSPEKEVQFKQALSAWISLSDLLWQKSELFRSRNVFLAHPRKSRLLIQEPKRVAERLLENWENTSPPNRKACPVQEASERMTALLASMRAGERLERPGDLDGLARKAVEQQGCGGEKGDEEWADRLAKDFSAFTD